MSLDAIEVFHVALPLKQSTRMPWGMSEKLHTVLVRLQSGSLVGWGEASPGNGPWESGEWAGGAFLAIRDWLAPALLEGTVSSAQDLQERLRRFGGNRYAKSALDTAWWDLEARKQDKPLHRMLGAERDAVAIGPTFDQMETIDELLATMHKVVQDGFSRVGLKFRPGWDVQMVNFVRQDFPTEEIHIDCEGALRLDQMEMLCRLDDFSLTMIEQPLPPDDLVGHAMLQETIRTPVCLDEGVMTVEQADMALELHSCKYVKIEPGRVGGLTPAMAIHDTCHHGCTPCWVGAVPQSAIGMWAAMALAAKPNFIYPADYLPMEDLLAVDLAPPPRPTLDPADSVQRVSLPVLSGLGVEPDPKTLETYCVERATVK